MIQFDCINIMVMIIKQIAERRQQREQANQKELERVKQSGKKRDGGAKR